MLALETGWTPDVIGALSAQFRAACHWLLYARAISGPEGLPHVSIPKGGPISDRLDAQRLMVEVAKVRNALFPDGD